MARLYPQLSTCRFDSTGERRVAERLDKNLVSLYSSEGLEFPLVVIPRLGDLPRKGNDPADEARLLYVGTTRALDRLILTCSRE